MSSFRNDIAQTVSPLAVEAAISPALHEANCRSWGCEPFTRERVERQYGEQAALAWDDLRAANNSFYRAVDRYFREGQKDGN